MNVYLAADEEETQNSIKLIQKEERIKSKMIWCFHVLSVNDHLSDHHQHFKTI